MTEQKNELAKFAGYQIFLITLLALLQFSILLDFMIISALGDILMKTLSMDPRKGCDKNFYGTLAKNLTAAFAERTGRLAAILELPAGINYDCNRTARPNFGIVVDSGRLVVDFSCAYELKCLG